MLTKCFVVIVQQYTYISKYVVYLKLEQQFLSIISQWNRDKVKQTNKKRNPYTCYNMGEPRGHYAKWNKQSQRGQKLDESS